MVSCNLILGIWWIVVRVSEGVVLSCDWMVLLCCVVVGVFWCWFMCEMVCWVSNLICRRLLCSLRMCWYW